MIYILFGEIGVGKNYVGYKLANYLNCQFFDGDICIPDEMKQRVKKFKFLPDELITNFVDKQLIPYIHHWADKRSYSTDLVVAQALYKRKHRQMILDRVRGSRLIYISPPSFAKHLSYLLKRKDYRWITYWLLSKPFFQKPDGNVIEIVSNNKIGRQIRKKIK